MSATIESEIEQFLSDLGGCDVVYIEHSSSRRKLKLLHGAEDEFFVVYPQSYPAPGPWVFESKARRLASWVERVNEAVGSVGPVAEVLRIALATPTKCATSSSAGCAPLTKKRRHAEEEDDSGGADADDDDGDDWGADDGDGDAPMGDARKPPQSSPASLAAAAPSSASVMDEDGFEDSHFQEGLEVLKMKKRWARKEDEIRAHQRVEGAERSAKKKITQIFSSSAANGVLTNDLLHIMQESDKLGFSAAPIDDNIYEWDVKMFNFRPGSQVAKDIDAVRHLYGYEHVQLRVSFTMDLYPFYPPTVRVVRPRFVGFMMGRVTSMDILKLAPSVHSPAGVYWDPVRAMSTVLEMIRELLNEHGKLDVNNPMNDIKAHPEGAYTELEYLLLRLELLTETQSRVHGKYPQTVSPAPTPTVAAPSSCASPPARSENASDGSGAARGSSSSTSSASSSGGGGKKTYWAKGTGYGYGSGAGTTWDVSAYLAAQQQKDDETEQIIRAITRELAAPRAGSQGPSYDVLEESCLVPVLEGYFRNDSLMDMARHASLYAAVHDLARALAASERLLPLFEQLPRQPAALVDLLRTQNTQSRVLLRTASHASSDPAAAKTPYGAGAADPSIELANAVVETTRLVEEQLQRASDSIRELESTRGSDANALQPSAAPPEAAAAAAAAAPAETAQQAYERQMRPLQFDFVAMDVKTHHFASAASAALGKQAAIRVAQEQSVLIKSLPLTVDSSVFVRADDGNICFLRALVTGPMAADYGATSTPYAGGCFVFDVCFPSNYPEAPPMVNLQTTGHGTVRFNPNLYNCGKVCLSLLGTWSGAEGETWNRSTSTLLQVLVSIQSLIFVPEPFFNEPGYETQMGTASGQQSSAHYNETIRLATLEHAVIGQLRAPPADFAEVVRRHFYLQQDRIAEQARRWLDEAQRSNKAIYSRMLKLVAEMQAEFAKLSYPFPKLPR
eukprot:m51a1_g4815 hypothetical protein (960) ;mRNA; r:142906-146614